MNHTDDNMKGDPAKNADRARQTDLIELRGEKEPRHIGEIPRSLTRWNLIVTLFFLLALFLAAALIPYPYSGGESILRHLLSL